MLKKIIALLLVIGLMVGLASMVYAAFADDGYWFPPTEVRQIRREATNFTNRTGHWMNKISDFVERHIEGLS